MFYITLITNTILTILGTYLFYEIKTIKENKVSSYEKKLCDLHTKLNDQQNFLKRLQSKIEAQTKMSELLITQDSIFQHINLTSLKILIDSGIDINIKDNRGKTLIHYNYKSLEILKALLNAGADVNIKSPNGHAIFHSEMVGNTEFVDLMLEFGADLNLKDTSGITILQYAIKYPPIFKKLVERGANVNIQDNTGMTIRKRIQYYYGSNKEIDDILDSAGAI